MYDNISLRKIVRERDASLHEARVVRRMGWGTFVEDTFVEGTLVEWNIGRTEHWSNGTFV